MDDELKKIELETARIRLLREKIALDGEIAKRDRNLLISNGKKNTIDTVIGVTQFAAKSSASISIRVFKAVLTAGLYSLIVILLIAKEKNWDTQHLLFNFGLYIGTGGFIPILIAGATGHWLFFDDQKSWSKGAMLLFITIITIIPLFWVKNKFY
jgi:hypothetical protein